MSSNKPRETRERLQNELQQIAEFEGEITSEMADNFDRIEGEIREADAKIRDAEIRGRFSKINSEPAHQRVAPGSGAGIETATTDDESSRWERLTDWFRNGGSNGRELRLLNSGDDSALVPVSLQQQLAKKMGPSAGARAAVGIKRAPGDMVVPVVSTRVSVTGVTASGIAFTDTEPAYTEANFKTVAMATAHTEYDVAVMQDATPDFIADTFIQHAEELTRLWSSIACNGLTVSGVAMSDGLFDQTKYAAGNIEAVTGAITPASLISMRYSKLPAEYWDSYGDLGWVMGQGALGEIMATLDGNGRPLFIPAAESTLASAIRGTLLGLPVYIDAAAPVADPGTAGTYNTVALVARNAYQMVDREPGLVTAQNPFAQQSKGVHEINSYFRSVGRWIRPEAAVLLRQTFA